MNYSALEEPSKSIFKQAPIPLMEKVYLPYHTMSVEMTIGRLKETYADKQAKKTDREILGVYTNA